MKKIALYLLIFIVGYHISSMVISIGKSAGDSSTIIDSPSSIEQQTVPDSCNETTSAETDDFHTSFGGETTCVYSDERLEVFYNGCSIQDECNGIDFVVKNKSSKRYSVTMFRVVVDEEEMPTGLWIQPLSPNEKAEARFSFVETPTIKPGQIYMALSVFDNADIPEFELYHAEINITVSEQ